MNQKQGTHEDSSLFYSPITIRNCLLTWLVPGIGYFFLDRKRDGIIVMSCLFAAILLGTFMGGDLFPLDEGWLRRIGSFCQLGMGAPFFLGKLFLGRGTPLSTSYDYGTNYFLIAGMLNWLAVMDIFDISVKRK